MNAKANNTNEKVRQLQRTLYQSAKKGRRRFHALYDKVYREDILMEAWKRVKANKGAGGVDEMSIKDVELYGVAKFLKETQEILKTNSYKAPPVKRKFIDKADGSKRPLGIPTVRDRVVQTAVKIMIEPIFEADFKESSYGFRPKRSAKMALEEVRKACNNKGYYVVDADIKSYFDRINHEKLMLLIEQRISDRRILKLLKNWLKAGILNDGSLEATEMGAAQGGVVSPLCANIYLNVLDTLWEKHGKQYGKLVRYADDLVVISKNKKSATHAEKLIKAIMDKLELELNPEKTKLVSMWDGKEGFDFLGMHHRRITSETSKGAVYKETFQYPKKQAMKKMKQSIKDILGNRSALVKDMDSLVAELNPKLRGWRNYYGTKTAKRWLASLDWYVIRRYTIWYNKKHQKRNHLRKLAYVRETIYEKGLVRLSA